MSLWTRILNREERNPARELAMVGHAKRRASVLEVARQIRRETGQPDDPRLKPPKETGDAK